MGAEHAGAPRLIHFGHLYPLATEREFTVDVVYAPFALKEGLKARVLRAACPDPRPLIQAFRKAT